MSLVPVGPQQTPSVHGGGAGSQELQLLIKSSVHLSRIPLEHR